MKEFEKQKQCNAMHLIHTIAQENDLTVIIFTNEELDNVPSIHGFECSLIEHGNEIISMYAK